MISTRKVISLSATSLALIVLVAQVAGAYQGVAGQTQIVRRPTATAQQSPPPSVDAQRRTPVTDRAVAVSRALPPGVYVGEAVTVAKAGIAKAGIAEPTMAVLPPSANPACAAGRIFFGSGSTVLYVDLNAAGGTPTATDFAAKVKTTKDLADPYIIYDNQIVATGDGRLFYTFEGVIWRDDVMHKPWWDDTKTYPLKGKSMAGGRGAIFIFESKNCGTDWQQLPPVDAAKLPVINPSTNKTEDGYCGRPRLNVKDKTSEAGGWDGHYAYADPYNGNLYITTSCTTGEGDLQGLVLLSQDGGQKWRVASQINHPGIFWRVPLTSLANGQVAYAYPANGKAYIRVASSAGMPFSPSHAVADLSYPSDTDPKMSDRVGLNASMYAYLTLARTIASGTHQSFQLGVYGSDGGDAIYRLYDYEPQQSAPALLTDTVKGAKKGDSVLQGTLVETTGQKTPFVFYWLEQVSKGQFQVRFKPYFNGPGGVNAHTVSQSFSTPVFNGDYIGGASYETSNGWRFLLAWSEAGTLKFADMLLVPKTDPSALLSVQLMKPQLKFQPIPEAMLRQKATIGEVNRKENIKH